MKRIIKVNNENAKNRLITIDYVFPKAITWLCRRKRIQSIVFVHVLNRKNNYSEAKFSNFLLFYFNSPGQYIFGLPVSPYTAKFVITFKKTTISEIISLETVWITTDFSRPISSIKNLRKITFSIFFILKRRNIENVMLESMTFVKHSCTMNLFSYCFAVSYVYSFGVTLNLRSSRRNIVFFFHPSYRIV